MLIALLLGVVVIVMVVIGQGAVSFPVSQPPVADVVSQVQEQIETMIPGAQVTTTTTSKNEVAPVSEYDWGPVVPMLIGTTAVNASVAITPAERMKGLSGTPPLPPRLVKLFVFESDGPQSIWMKDMNYSIDIIWIDTAGIVVHIEERVDPSTYPTSFSSPIPARYVVEVSAGFVADHTIVVGTPVTLPLLTRN